MCFLTWVLSSRSDRRCGPAGRIRPSRARPAPLRSRRCGGAAALSTLQQKRSFFECFPYVCPEPVLVKISFLYINGAKTRLFTCKCPVPKERPVFSIEKCHESFVVFCPEPVLVNVRLHAFRQWPHCQNQGAFGSRTGRGRPLPRRCFACC